MFKNCHLCGENKPLQLSHILPKFAIKWLKTSAVSGIRGTSEPNKRIQDGTKIPLLCYDCEQMFSRWENDFAQKVFSPQHHEASNIFPFSYKGKWLIEFAVSVSWRVLNYFILNTAMNNFSTKEMEIIRTASERWKLFLLKRYSHPAQFEQHFIPCSEMPPSHLLKTN